MVCQKDAATKVVRNRLQQAELDELCIEVHDAEEDRPGFFRTIREQVDGLAAPPDVAADRDRLALQIEAAEQELDAFAVAMRGVDEQVGLGYRDVLAFEGVALERFPDARPLAAGSEAGTPLPMLPIDGDPATWLDRIEPALAAVRGIAGRGATSRRVLDEWLMFFESAPPEAAAAALAAADDAVAAADHSEARPADPGWEEVLATAGSRRIDVVAQACRVLTAAERLPAWRRGRRTVQALRPDAVGPLLAEVAAAGLAQVESLAAAEAVRRQAATAHPRLRPSFEDPRQAARYARLVRSLADEAGRLVAARRSVGWLAPLITAALAGKPLPAVVEEALAVAAARRQPLAAVLARLAGMRAFLADEELRPLLAKARQGESLAEWVAAARDGLGRIQPLAAWESLAEREPDPRCRTVIRALAAVGSHPAATAEEFADWWVGLFRLSIAERWRETLLERHDVLRRIDPGTHRRLIEDLKDKVAAKRRLEAPAILATWRRRQEAVRSFQWAAVFKLRSGSRGPAMRLREAVAASCDHGLLNLRPCWLTNPAAAAQTLPRRAHLFDLVIFDEASQCPLEQAIPSLFRGRRALIAGDRKQLPPTSFFASGSDDDDDLGIEPAAAHDHAVEEDLLARLGAAHVAASEDLLGAVVGVLPERYLRVHYRSEDPALIEFSNHAFYGGRLETPPAARPAVGRPPIVHLDAGGIYDRRRTNLQEARAVVETVAEMILQPPVPTVGVVTFNQPQRELIEDLLEERAHGDPVFDEAYRREVARQEANLDVGLFVKNLENVQGDERDVMIFSTTFGRDDAGRFFRRFGPVGQVGGERRLNVAVTRARRQVIVATSMPIEEIAPALRDLGGTGSLSPPAYLQFYLAYARALTRHDRDAAAAILRRLGRTGPQVSLGGEESPFEIEVREAVERLGYQAHPQIGDGGFRIDLAVPHPDPARGYALAIECDGAAYHSDRSARIRDVWRQGILEQRGWRFHRIWSRSWWQERPAELDRLAAALAEAVSS